jgi:parallel beta-helix repeat protein
MAAIGCDKVKSPIAPPSSNQSSEALYVREVFPDSTRGQGGLPLQRNNENRISAATIQVPDDYPTIQAAIDAATPGNKIIVKDSGSPYNEILTIAPSQTGVRLTAKGEVTLNGRIRVQANEVTVEGFRIHTALPFVSGGIEVMDATDVTISRNQITGSYHGIWIMRSRNCVVTMNTVSGAEWVGILLFEGNDGVVRDNRLSENWAGISLILSENTSALRNDCTANRVWGMELTDGCKGNLVKNNVCSRNGNGGFVLAWNSNQNTIGPGNTANSNGGYGILFYPAATGNTVRNNDFHCNLSGDILDQAGGNIFVNNSTGQLPGGCP